ncbi:BMP family ABC transporter substrate-binding protein [soil metagenome]
MRRAPLLAVAMATTVLALAACSTPAPTEPATDSIQITAPLSGQLGDKSFMDSANEGLTRAADELGVTVKVVEAGADDAPAWERNLTEASASGENDLIVTGGTVVASTLEKVAAQFPDQQYLIFDSETVGDNVTGISYAQNEGAFLVGALAAIITNNPDEFPRATGSGIIGVAAGMDIPVIQDFIVGFTQGAQAVDPDIVVDVRFINDFASAQKGYDVATAIFNAGADVVYQVAGAAGLGVLQAGADAGRYSIGTDSDQNGLHPESTPASAIKSVGNTVFNGIQAYLDGTLEMGITIRGDISNDGVGIAYNDELVPEQFIQQIDELRQQVIDGDIVVDTAL